MPGMSNYFYLSELSQTVICNLTVIILNIYVIFLFEILSRKLVICQYSRQLLIFCMCAFRVLNPRQWSLTKQWNLKSWKVMTQKCLNKLKPKGMMNKPTKLQFQSILTRKILMLSNATNQPKSTVELGYMCPRGLFDPPAVTLTK